jgi:flagellar basal body-associated protein FliL
MLTGNSIKKNRIKKILIIGLILFVAAVGVAWYMYTNTFSDTSKEKAAYTFNALDFIAAFQQNDSTANKKYAEQIITINGRVTAIEQADTTVNIKMADTITGSYVIFAFQQQDAANVKKVKQGDSVSIKGSCSGGVYSDILQTEFITFKRCSINQ